MIKKIIALLVVAAIGAPFMTAQTRADRTVMLIPEPSSIILSGDKEYRLKSISETILARSGMSSESYSLVIRKGKAEISAPDRAGIVHGRATLAQLAGVCPEDIMNDDAFIGAMVRNMKVQDSPAFPIRGFMHDTGRNFREVETLKREIDLMAFYKLNVFHWHLTDNPAWRIECRAYPQLNDPQYQRKGRDEGRFYTYEQIRDVIAYASERGITVIPEIDMPGHSQYFDRTFGFSMASEKGMEVLKACLEEFLSEIPAEMCPYVHIGSDEVHVADPQGFMQFCEDLIISHGRTPLAWYPGLPSSDTTISQIWSDEGRRASGKGFPRRYIDSYMGYLNLGNPIVNTMNFFLHQLCSVEAGDEKAMGGILCLWNDVRVTDKTRTLPHNGMPEGMLGFAQSSWGGGDGYEGSDTYLFPVPGTEAYEALGDFEEKMAYHRDSFLAGWNVRWVANAHIPWTAAITSREIRAEAKAWGGCIDLNALCSKKMIPSDRQAEVVLTTEIHVTRDTVITAWVGFDSPSRSTRMSDGIGEQGKWENGGRVHVFFPDGTSAEVFPSNPWNEPGSYRYHHHTWHQAPNELPYTDEQFFWMRDPALIPLKAGRNVIQLYCPHRFRASNRHAAFIPLTIGPDGTVSEPTGIRFVN